MDNFATITGFLLSTIFVKRPILNPWQDSKYAYALLYPHGGRAHLQSDGCSYKDQGE